MRFAGAAMNSDYTSAAGKDAFGQASKNAPNFGKLTQSAMAERSKERQQSMYSSAQVAGAGLASLGAATEAENNAKAGIAAAEAEASATQMGGVMDMFGSLGGAAIGAMKPSFDYGKTRIGAGGGVVDGKGTFGPNYGFIVDY